MKLNESTINEYPWLLFKIFGISYAVSSKEITAITNLPEKVTIIPDKPYYIRGLMELRGGHIKLIDMRALLNLASFDEEKEEFYKMLDDRKQDHVNWVNELERCINEKCEFKLATDSTKCKLGKWHSDYSTKSTLIEANLCKLDEPHRKIHKVAIEVEQERLRHTDPDKLKEVHEEHIARAKQYMEEVLDILETTKKLHQQEISEMVIVFENHSDDDEPYAIVVDEVLSVDEIELLDGNNTNNSVLRRKFINGIGKSIKSKEIVLLLDYTNLLEKED